LVAQADVGKPQLVSERLGDLLFRSEIEAYEYGTDAFAGFLMVGERDLKVVLRDQPRLYETFPDFLAHSIPLILPAPLPLARAQPAILALPRRPFNPQEPPPQTYTNLHAGRLLEHDTPLVHSDDRPAPQKVANANDLAAVDGREPAILGYQDCSHAGNGVLQ